MIDLNIGDYIEAFIDWLTANFDPLFDLISAVATFLIDAFEAGLLFIPAWIIIIVVSGIAWWIAGRGVGIFSLVGLFLVDSMGLWAEGMATLALVISSTLVALIIGIPVGIWVSRSALADKIVRPILDFMQTMPAFVYLIPAVFFFSLGKVPGMVATVIFAMPPAVRLTSLGIRQVQKEVVEAAHSFGATPKQVLFKVQLPLALPTILAGINQTIMLALSMVVIAAMIGAGGLGQTVLKGLTQLKTGLGFEGGFAIVILAIILDRITQALGSANNKS
ncbi:ABC transporter permease subunit [candidate division GN15 bacterium]|nr:ABC transporter permease subunit [candidate division GN15 bacterium]